MPIVTILKSIFDLIGIRGCIIVGLIVFYEGIFFMNFWPVNTFPYAGKIIEGEISRRIDVAVSGERGDWEKRIRDKERQRDQERITAENALDKFHREARRIESERAKEDQEIIAGLKSDLDALGIDQGRFGPDPTEVPTITITDTANAKPKKRIVSIHEPLPSGIIMHLNDLRRRTRPDKGGEATN